MTPRQLHRPLPAALGAGACALLAACAVPARSAPVPAGPTGAGAFLPAAPGEPAAIDAEGGSCLTTLPDSLLTVRDTVFLHSFLVDTTARALLPEADLLAQRTAHRLRLLLGGRLDSLPSGAPAVTWRTVIGGNLEIRARRDGNATWQELPPRPIPDTVLTRLLARAVDSVVRHREMITWTVEAARDSVEMRLALAHTAEPAYARAIGAGFPVFALRRPVSTRALVVSLPRVRYPTGLHTPGAEDRVTLQVTIDTLGAPEPASIHELWPEDRPRLAGDTPADHLLFGDAGYEALIRTRFLPARIGGCPVRATQNATFTFTVVRGVR